MTTTTDGGPRPYPQSLEAERALLGGLLQRPEALARISEDLAASHFYRRDHAELYALLLEMSAAGEAIDLVTVPDRVARDGNPGRFGGVAYVTELPEHAPSTANLGHYAATIGKKAIARAVIARSQELAEAAYASPDDVAGLVDEAQSTMMELGGQARRSATWRSSAALVDEAVGEIESTERTVGLTGLTTGFGVLDRLLGGLHGGDLIILAARPSMGKTALALNMAANAALLGGVDVGIFSLEMSRQQVIGRMLSTMSQVDLLALRSGRLSDVDWSKLADASERLRAAPIHVCDKPESTLSAIRGHARRLALDKPNLGLIVVDYLQLMAADDERQPRVQQVSDLSAGLKGLARELRVPVLALSQLSRHVEARTDKRPMMSDLRDSGSIEQDADVVAFIYRDDYYNPDSPARGVAEVIVAKHRNGPIGSVELIFQGRYTRFDNRAA